MACKFYAELASHSRPLVRGAGTEQPHANCTVCAGTLTGPKGGKDCSPPASQKRLEPGGQSSFASSRGRWC
jgi:hypothetical protein